MARPKKVETVVTPVREVCQWCTAEITAGQNPPILGICADCRQIQDRWEAETPCPNCGGRKRPSVGGVFIKNGHRDSCITNAESVTPRRALTDEDVAEIRKRLGPAPVPLSV